MISERREALKNRKAEHTEEEIHSAKLKQETPMLERALALGRGMAEVGVATSDKLEDDVVGGVGASTLVSSANPDDAVKGDGASTEMSSAPSYLDDAVKRKGASTPLSSDPASDESTPSVNTTTQPSPASVHVPVAGPFSTSKNPKTSGEDDDGGLDVYDSDDSCDDEDLLEDSLFPLRDRIERRYALPIKSELTARHFRRQTWERNRKVRRKLAKINLKLMTISIAKAEAERKAAKGKGKEVCEEQEELQDDSLSRLM